MTLVDRRIPIPSFFDRDVVANWTALGWKDLWPGEGILVFGTTLVLVVHEAFVYSEPVETKEKAERILVLSMQGDPGTKFLNIDYHATTLYPR